ncbi:MAG: GNAT family N-acetyltransferase [Fermentimonas sp.]|jgi:lipid II:glycine glycyltransferase (peptidoglycan interpeptide bridge formation enzyme)
MDYVIKTYYSKKDLPEIEDKSFFHSKSSFDWYARSSRYNPLMIVAFRGEVPVGAMFAVIIRRNRLLTGRLFKRCVISQAPMFYADDISEIELFDEMLTHLVNEVKNKVFVIRYQSLASAIFGYKGFRENKFFSVRMVNVRNSLQKKRDVWNQLSSSRKRQINKATKKGAVIEEVTSEDMLPVIYDIIKEANSKKIRRRFPPYEYFENFFIHYIKNGKGKILLLKYQDKIIGGTILGFEGKSTVYCLYYWGKSKRYKSINPTIFTIYSAMYMAEQDGFEYFDFMDVTYINKRAGRLYFLLQFGGKQSATRRWFRFNWGLLNFFANKIYD